jgi:phenylacetate-coenzyme A ligase PaaK-like adenylate-forming protein
LRRFQLQALNRTIDHVRSQSPFYQDHLCAFPWDPLTSLDRLSDMPFTTAAHIRSDPLAFVCVSQSDIARVVTMETSGTTGPPKRLFFTDDDLELTTDFFHHGMSTLVEPGQRVLILMPGQLPGSVGDLLVRALARMDVAGIVHGPVQDPAVAVAAAIGGRVDSLVGIPVQVLAMACVDGSERLAGRIRSVLLSTDYVSDAIVRRIGAAWNCRVFKHYGMTEMGLGGGVECAARSGYHLREADLLVEIVDPVAGTPLPDGETGELVVTTLTRQGMPLIRYRSGDLAAFSNAGCVCGTVLKTLSAVRGRVSGRAYIGGASLFLADLDEAFFGIESVLDFTVQIDDSGGVDRLSVTIHVRPGSVFDTVAASVKKALFALPVIAGAVAAGRLKVRTLPAASPAAVSTGVIKRRLHDKRAIAMRKDANP